jgi:hypothetical protein
MHLRAAQIGALRLIATQLAPSVHLVRFFPGDGPHYDRMIVVTEKNEGGELHLSGWIGKPLAPAEWLAARDALFPDAEAVVFERLQADGSFSHRRLPLPRKEGEPRRVHATGL